MKSFNPVSLTHSKYIFFTGKGGVGKTSTACATAVHLADGGKKILLVSTDPASNLQDVFDINITNTWTTLEEVPNLVVANLDPLQAAEDYKERVIGPYRGKLPVAVIDSMAEQLSGSCTVEIAAFNEFSNLLTDADIRNTYDHILFDTAPTGHTLRMLQLPSAWSNFISENNHGASCLGQLSGLEDKKGIYRNAMETLANPDKTTLVLVAKPDNAPLAEAERASRELREIGVENQTLIINGVLSQYDDAVSQKLFEFQQSALETMPEALKQLEQSQIPLRAYNVTGVEKVRAFLTSEDAVFETVTNSVEDLMNMDHVIQDLLTTNKKVIFTMGKGGVGKTSIAAKIAHGLLEKGKKVHLTTTDPAAHLKWVTEERLGLTMSHIDEKAELEKYREEVLGKARCEMFEEDLAYIEEDLRSPCTQEIAVFRAFAEIVDKADHEVVVVDTAPTGHTLLLLDATQSYHREIQRSQGDIPESVKRLLPRLRDPQETEVVIVSLAEATPFYEAKRLEADLKRAGIYTNWWVINASLYAAETSNAFLRAKGGNELEWIRRIRDHASGSAAVIEWTPQVWRMNAADIS
jgi:arsenite-transporting ATPase